MTEASPAHDRKGGAETRRPSLFRATCVAVAFGAAFAGCKKQPSPEQPQDAQAALVARGRTAYLTHCTACHNSDPARDGSLGPAVWGSSLELLRARILRAEYPAGYTPKRPSHQMVPLPHLQDQIGAIHAFLTSSG